MVCSIHCSSPFRADPGMYAHQASPTPNRLSAQLSPFEAASGRQSPFRRQNSQSPATAARGATPSASPTKPASSLSTTKTSSLSPEKPNPFTRRPSQIGHASERPSSPFARPTSSLSVVSSPSRNLSNTSLAEPFAEPTFTSPTRKPNKTQEEDLQQPDTPTLALSSPRQYDRAHRSSPGTHPEESPFYMPPSPAANTRPAMPRNYSSSTATTIKPPAFTANLQQTNASTPKLKGTSGNSYHHISQPLLHSMRESFEVLDSGNTGNVNSVAVADMLAQLGLDSDPSALMAFFPPSGPVQVNLARYLDMLSAPLADLSQPDELRAAFEAFDVDDSGQIDIGILRDALLNTAPQPGEDAMRLSERDVDCILREYTSRRAFGTRGLQTGTSKGEVFKYRDFMTSMCGSDMPSTEAAPMA